MSCIFEFVSWVRSFSFMTMILFCCWMHVFIWGCDRFGGVRQLYLVGFYILVWFFTLICSTMFVGSLVGRVLGSCNLGFCIRVETLLKCLFLFYLFFANQKKKKQDILEDNKNVIAHILAMFSNLVHVCLVVMGTTKKSKKREIDTDFYKLCPFVFFYYSYNLVMFV